MDSNEAVVTAVVYDSRLPEHLRDPTTGRGVVPTSSSTAPWLMACMLDALQLEPGMRVLEIGTGTGYNAALLDVLVGAQGHVTSVEVDPQVAEQAREALARDGRRVDVITGDGAEGYAAGSPYDRVIATAAVHTVPYSWVVQTCPGGLLVVPWAPTFHPDSPLAVLTVGEDGTAEGRFGGPAHFMPLHSQRIDPSAVNQIHDQWGDGGPGCERFGVTITPEHQRVWMDDPDHQISMEDPWASTRSQ
ncbi:methyltransferase domain-containing protein [Lipingzhangella sp. LS1_29]|uniref:Protein-L-isoaspartate O-methyltransferase n=1 Tax=Lipingzhangella rawalii TaxID=2055835 RepID=A0ABU2H7F5_9ACTN|nr:methyltransferase domain-containing protein [Lipingzhangella rawalii]